VDSPAGKTAGKRIPWKGVTEEAIQTTALDFGQQGACRRRVIVSPGAKRPIAAARRVDMGLGKRAERAATDVVASGNRLKIELGHLAR
jgi:hypothetical protein